MAKGKQEGAGISITIIILCTKNSSSTKKFCLTSGERGPGLGDTPGGPAELLPWPGGAPYSARPGLMCLSTLDVPVAGGELAHRGTCPTLVLCLFKRNTPQIKVSPYRPWREERHF